MSEKLTEVYEQYDMDILNTRKGRGATILTTNRGLRILEPFRGNITRLEQEYVLKQILLEAGCFNLDYIILNKNDMLLTTDKYRQPFVLKKYFDGNECDLHSIEDIKRAIRALANFHRYGKKATEAFHDAWMKNRKEKEEKQIEEIRRTLEKEEDIEKLSFLYEMNPEVLENILVEYRNDKSDIIYENTDVKYVRKSENKKGIEKDTMLDLFSRHNKELRKIHKYVSKVKKKNAFENLLLKVFAGFYEQGLICYESLQESIRMKDGILMDEVLKNHSGICHGSYNQHNVILGNDFEAIVHFERFSNGNQLNDLYQFTRKTMEKNQFDFSLLQIIFDTYNQEIPLTLNDMHYMFLLFSYPEKFWKICNSYYNANKAFLSPKFLEKLKTVILQETEKRKMIEIYKEVYL